MNRARNLPERSRDIALTLGAILGVLCGIVAVLALVLDLRLLAFRSGSMAPAIQTGALAVSRSVPAHDLTVGDVVTVTTSSGSLVTHRIVGVEHQPGLAILQLRGDANSTSDPEPYEVARADRVVFSVPWLGYAGGAVMSPIGLFVLGLYAAVLLGYLVPRGGAQKHRSEVVSAAVLLVAATCATGLVASRTATTSAAWVDAAATSGSVLATGAVPVPANFSCGGIGIFSVAFSWSAVPGATSYTVHYGNGGTSVATVSGTSATLTTVISGGTAWVTANINYGSTLWTSQASNTRNYSVLFVSLCG